MLPSCQSVDRLLFQSSSGFIEIEAKMAECFPLIFFPSFLPDSGTTGEVVKFHVAPDPETGGYTGWIRTYSGEHI